MARQSLYSRGAFAPAREEVTAFNLPVTGKIPADLDGRYLRNGPNPVGIEHPRAHYFLGAGMIHGVRIVDGNAEWYRNRWVRQAPVSRALGEERRAYTVLGGMDGSSNTSVIGHAGRVLSLVEGGTLPFELGEELETIGPHDFQGGLRGGMSAHPKVDPYTGELHTVGYFAGSPTVDYHVISTDGRIVRSQAIELPHCPMMHDFALTKNYVVLFDLPAAFSRMAAVSGDSFPFRWNAGAQSRLGLMPRSGQASQIVWFEIEPVWIYHTVNAFDVADGVVLDVVTHPSMFAGPRGSIEGHGTPSLERFNISKATGSVRRQRLDDTPQEFPRINERRLGEPHRFAYTASSAALVDSWRPGPRDLDDLDDADFGNVLFKHDTQQSRTAVRTFGPDAAVGEAVFVPRADGSSDEDDGYLMCYVHDPDRGATDLVILSAADFAGDELARIHLPVRVPLGLHGAWVPTHGTRTAGQDMREGI